VDIANLYGSEKEENLECSLRSDLLCGLAWFNLGNLNYSSGKVDDAVFCYTMCSLVQKWDIESWVNATACSFSGTIPVHIFALLIRAGYFCNGDRYIDALYQAIENNQGAEVLSDIAEVIEQLLSEDRNSREKTPVIRMLNDEGIFENMLDKDYEIN